MELLNRLLLFSFFPPFISSAGGDGSGGHLARISTHRYLSDMVLQSFHRVLGYATRGYPHSGLL